MVRPRDPETMGLSPYSAADGQWFDYDGDEIYGDLSLRYDDQIPQLDVTDVMAHEPGLAQYDFSSEALHHLHGNLIGTTERMTDAAGSIAHRAVYTAFGELIQESGTVATRYGYAGAYGYQTASSQEPADPLAELGWLHVGERYYDPSSGRFVQRDPIGIRGGGNVYSYVLNQPTARIDSLGLIPDQYPGEWPPPRDITPEERKGRQIGTAYGAAGVCVVVTAILVPEIIPAIIKAIISRGAGGTPVPPVGPLGPGIPRPKDVEPYDVEPEPPDDLPSHDWDPRHGRLPPKRLGLVPYY
jgi:RHS repeat-associated protein